MYSSLVQCRELSSIAVIDAAETVVALLLRDLELLLRIFLLLLELGSLAALKAANSGLLVVTFARLLVTSLRIASSLLFAVLILGLATASPAAFIVAATTTSAALGAASIATAAGRSGGFELLAIGVGV